MARNQWEFAALVERHLAWVLYETLGRILDLVKMVRNILKYLG